nr:C-type lectin 9a-like [Lytechinus pictus]
MNPTRIQTVHHLLVTWVALQTLSMGCPLSHPPPVPATPSVCQNQCPSGWNYLDKSCYIIVGEPLPWPDAELRCHDLVVAACGHGVMGHLASIYGDVENNFVHCLWKRMGRGDMAIDNIYWIGLTKQSGHLYWTDGSLPLYHQWDSGVQETVDSEDGFCTYVSGRGISQKKWNTTDCEHPVNRVNGLPFACEFAQAPNQPMNQPEPVRAPGPV